MDSIMQIKHPHLQHQHHVLILKPWKPFKIFVLAYMNYDEREQFHRSQDTDYSKALTQDICNSPISIQKIIAHTK